MQKPDSAQGLKKFSSKFLNDVLKLNLKTPPEIVLGLTDLEGLGALQAYEDSIGKDAVIDNYHVKNPGSISSVSDDIRNKILKRNRPINQTDFSELDGNSGNLGYTYYALSNDIGKLAQLSDYNVPTLQSVDSQFNLSSNEMVKINILNNKFTPETLDTFETKVLKTNTPQQPYVDDNGQLNNAFNTKEYTPADILSINVSKSYNYSDDPLTYIKYSGNVLQNETLLMNIAALELNGAFKYRINQAVQIDNTYTANVKDAMNNPLMAINILKDPKNNLIGKNYNITVPQNIIGKAEQFTGSLLGTYDLVQYLNLEKTPTLTPTCFNTTSQGAQVASQTAFGRLVNDMFGRSVASDRDTSTLADTGSGQKFQLFSNLYFNKYAPNYDPQYQSGVFKAIDSALQSIAGVTGFLGLSGGKRPNSRYYFGDKTLADPFYVLQDADGNQDGSPEEITNTIIQNYDTGIDYDEPGYDEVSSYGTIPTDLVWHKNGYTESFYDPITGESIDRIDTNNGVANKLVDDDARYSYHKNFRECSILWKTQNLLNNSDTNSGINMAIDQTKTKFYDGYSLYSKGSAVIAPTVQPKYDNGFLKGYSYSVNGVENDGKRIAANVASKSEFCRTWTKARPYAGIINAMKYSELIRLERNSVIDRYANYNIFPSSLNVNPYTSKEQSILNPSGIDNKLINSVTAKKYMFSIENLAWRDSELLNRIDFPNSERGVNGGRVMWFPPYDLKFTDDTTVNWTTHQFLGRPEPIYTYNSTERSGTLSFKIIVDHPTILNVLVEKELAKLPDGVVDEILNAFWAGCVNFDIYELARLWTQFSNSDIEYFKQVIAGLQPNKPNDQIKPKMDQTDAKPPTVVPNKTNTQESKTTDKVSLFFENDVPIATDDNVMPYGDYFTTYKNLNLGISGTTNSEVAKNDPYNFSKRGWIKYDQIIGSNSLDKYFFTETSHTEKWYQLYQGLDKLNNELQNAKNPGYDVNITINAFSSSLNGQTNGYNEALIFRRFKSVAKHILLNIMTGIKADNGDSIDKNNINSYFKSDNKSITVKRESGTKNVFDTITISLSDKSTTLNGEESLKAIGGVTNIKNMPVVVITSGSTTPVTFYCTDTQANKNALVSLGSSYTQDGVTYNFTTNTVGSLNPDKLNTNSLQVDVICSVLSIYASYSRRVEVSATTTPNPNIIKETTVPKIPKTTTPDVKPTNETNITKRTIAQRILNKLINEEQYFQKLEQDSPTVYSSMKEKLKYFTPAFHSMTPEGLNSRLTFLQQCLRPGDTITTSDSTQQGMDATNTAFGKPPICVLRIGDFYNTKIIISNLNITYDPLVFDLNPEGIGVQPMIANVSISFKYIGGSGLRQYVNELQNALSFNYYANADVYDDRTFANTDPIEKALINAETNPFDNNTLDLIPIVEKAKRFVMNDTTSATPVGTIGKFIPNTFTNTYLGDTSYSIAKQTAKDYDSSVKYLPETYVTDYTTGIYGINYYKRLFDDKINYIATDNAAGKSLTDTTAWEFVQNKNFGQQYYLNLYGTSNESGYLQTVQMNYIDAFKALYTDYLAVVNAYFNRITYDDKKNKKSTFLLNSIAYRNFTGDTMTENIFDNYSKSIFKTTIPTTTINGYFNTKAAIGNYSTLGSNFIDKNSPKAQAAKLYLYPQSLFYTNPQYVVSSDLTSMVTGNTFDPGYFIDSDGATPEQKSDVANIYIKNFKNDNVYNSFNTAAINDLTQRINNDLLVFWFSDVNLFNNYITDFTEPNKVSFRNYLISQLNSYQGNNSSVTVLYDSLGNDKLVGNLHIDVSGLSAVLGGYDAAYVDGGIENQYVVIPNESRLSTQTEKLFGYDPYDTYLNIFTVSYGNYQDTIKLSEVRSAITGDTSMLFGNGLYYFRQISALNSIIESPMLLNNNSYKTISGKSVLPKSSALDNQVDITSDSDNYQLKSSTGKNTISFDSTQIVGQTQFDTITASLKNVVNGTTLTNKYKMSYVYEKLNYEFFDFVNKTLGMVLNDSSVNYQIDIDNGYTTLVEDLKAAYGASMTDSVINILFPNTNNGFKYYNVIATGSTDTTYQDSVKTLATAIDFDYQLTPDYINYVLNKANVEDTTPYSFLYGSTNKLTHSSLSEAMLLDFFEDFYTNKDKHIAAITALMVDNTTDSDKVKARRLQKMTNIVTAFFEQINVYVKDIKTAQDSVISIYNDKVLGTLTTYYNTAFGTVDNAQVQSAGTITGKNMLKGGDKDYTLTLRTISNLNSSVPMDYISNFMIYNTNKQ